MASYKKVDPAYSVTVVLLAEKARAARGKCDDKPDLQFIQTSSEARKGEQFSVHLTGKYEDLIKVSKLTDSKSKI